MTEAHVSGDARVRAERRAALGDLAEAVRTLADAAATTAVEVDDLGGLAAEVRALTARLGRAVHDDVYSGLLGPEADFSRPEGPLPLSPVIGECNPSRPDVRLWFEGGRVVGVAVLTRRFIGPPGVAHGGVGAMLADQLLAVTPYPLGLRCVTKEMRVRYRRPIPLYREVRLVAEGERVDERRVRGRGTICDGDEVLLEAEADLVVSRVAALGRDRTR